MTEIEVGWQEIKDFVDTRSAKLQYVDYNGNYFLKVSDGLFSLSSILSQENAENVDLIDFETNYKTAANQRLELKDTDGAILQRLKVTSAGWALHYHGLEMTTSKIDGVIDRDTNNVDCGFATVKLYNSDGDLITEVEDEATCVKTVIDWEPTFSYDIIGGDVFLDEPPSTDIRVSVVGIPDIPANMGGSKAFMTGFNLKYVSPLGIHLDGKTPKSAVYNAVYHTNKIRFIFHHDAGVVHTVLVMLNIFKA